MKQDNRKNNNLNGGKFDVVFRSCLYENFE